MPGHRRIEKGVANIIFSTEPIEKGREDEVPLLARFTAGDSIFGRAYLPGPIGANVTGEIRSLLFVDDQQKLDLGRNQLDATWDQLRLRRAVNARADVVGLTRQGGT